MENNKLFPLYTICNATYSELSIEIALIRF